MSRQEPYVSLYLLAGVATAPNFMERFRDELVQRFREAGMHAEGKLLFPYGDWNRGVIGQIREIRHDTMSGFSRFGRSIGGRRAAEEIMNAYRGGRILIAGHSGGGVAGLHAASILEAERGIRSAGIVQIGAPKSIVPPDFRDKVLYISAIKSSGRPADPVTRLGSWAGWGRNRYGWPRRMPLMNVPGKTVRIPIIGWHPDYFRSGDAYRNSEGRTNLDLTTEAIWSWMAEQGWFT